MSNNINNSSTLLSILDKESITDGVSRHSWEYILVWYNICNLMVLHYEIPNIVYINLLTIRIDICTEIKWCNTIELGWTAIHPHMWHTHTHTYSKII